MKVVSLRFRTVMAVILAMCIALAGFSVAGGAARATRMEMWVFVELHSKFYKEMMQRWNKANPKRQIDIKFTVLPYDDMHNKLQLALQSGAGAPDLCDVEVGRFPNFLMGKPQLVELNDVVKPYRGKVVQSRLDLYSKDGKIYGLPTHVGATVAFYNTEILEAAGVDYKTIVTWDDYIQAGKQVLKKTGKLMGVAETSATWIISAMLAQQGSDLVTRNGAPNLNSPEMLKSVTLLQQMLKEGIIAVCPGGQPDTEEGFGFINSGKVANVIMPLWFMSRFKDYMTDLKGKIAIAPVPVFQKGMPRSVGLGGTGTVVTKTAKNIKLAKDFLAFAKLSETANIQIWEVLGFDPVNTGIWQNQKVTHNPNNAYVKYFKNNPFDVLNEIKNEIVLHRSVAASPAIYNLLGTQVQNKLFEKLANPAPLLRDAQAQIENELKN
jgi:arabinosaccharide transport system substrate-binding protein